MLGVMRPERDGVSEKRDVGEAFDQAAPEYDAWVRQALPAYEELFAVAVELIRFPNEHPLHFVDLGAGTGLFSARVLNAFPNAVGTLYDASAEMLAVARRRLGGHGARVSFVEQRLESLIELPRSDLVVSSLAIHHLEHAEKRALFARIHGALDPGGQFINVDQVRGEPPFGELYWSTWLTRIRQAGAPEARVQASVRRRLEFDRDASLDEQLTWMRAAGLDSDCIYKHHFVAVLLGLKREGLAA